MSTLHEAIRAQIDNYPAENIALLTRDALRAVLDIHETARSVTTGYCVGCSERGESGWNRLVNAPCPTVRAIARALGVSTVPAQPQRKQCAWYGDSRQCADWTQADSDYCDHHTTLRAAAFGTRMARRESYTGEPVGVPARPTRQWAVEHPSWETVVHRSITSALYTLDHPPLGDRARLVTRMSDQTGWVPCGRDGEPLPAQAEPRVWQPGDRVQWLRYSDDTITDTGTVVERDTQQWPGHVPVLPDYYRDGPRPLTHPVYINPKHLSEVTDQAGEAK